MIRFWIAEIKWATNMIFKKLNLPRLLLLQWDQIPEKECYGINPFGEGAKRRRKHKSPRRDADS